MEPHINKGNIFQYKLYGGTFPFDHISELANDTEPFLSRSRIETNLIVF